MRLSFAGHLDPDALAAGLAIQAAGATAVPAAGVPTSVLEITAATTDSAAAAGPWRLPACRSRLERWRPRPLDPTAGTDAGIAFGPQAPRISGAEVYGESARLASILPPVGLRRRRGEGRPILCASPALGPRTLAVLLGWTLHCAAAWVLEPDGEAFLPAVLWARPTVVAATGAEADRLAAALGERRHRRHHRLRALVVAGALSSAARWRELGVPVVEWPQRIKARASAAEEASVA